MNCPDENVLVAMIEHTLEPARLGELELHFDACVACRRVVAALAGGGRSLALGTAPNAWLGAFDDADTMVGTTVSARYEVKSLLGRGGMGTVYLAHDPTLGREVALKLHRAGSGEATRRLQREAMAMAKLAHPNVVTVFEIASVEDRMYVAMEYVRGGTLRGWLAAKPRGWREIVAMLLDTGKGLVAAHAAALIHRDFKPENVLVGDDGRPRVGDFGLARLDDEPTESGNDAVSGETAMTVTGAVLGTPAYMAPEQLAGDTVDARCDQFAFCVVAWECLFGRRPFIGSTIPAIRIAIENRELHRPARRDVPDRVRAVLERGLALDPGARFADMVTLLAALRSAAAPRRKRRIMAMAGAAIACAAGALVIASAVTERRHEATCDREGESVRRLFGTQTRGKLERDLVATGSPLAKPAFERTAVVLDRYATALAAETIAVCRGRDEPAPLVAARRACLGERTGELSNLIEALAQPDPMMVLRAPDAAWAIFDPAPCSDTTALLARPPAAASVPALATQLRRAKALLDTGRYQAGVEIATPLVEDAKRSGDRTLELAALLVLGQLHGELGATEAAVPVLHRAQALAESLGRDLDAATALDGLAGIAGLSQHDYTLAHRYVDLARAKLARLGGGHSALRGALLVTEAQILMDENRLPDGARAAREAIALFEQVYGPEHPTLGTTLGLLGQILRGLDQDTEALVASRRTLAILERALGADHPSVAGAHMNIASTLIDARDYAPAREELKTADAIFVKAFGPEHPRRAAVHGNLGDIEQNLRNWDAAIAAYRTAAGVLEKMQGPTSLYATGAHHDIARTLALAGRLDDALAEIERVIRILETHGADGEPRLRGALVELADIQLARSQAALALPAAERALAIATRLPDATSPDDLAATRFTLARVLWEANRDRARALALARDAATVQPDAAKRAAIESWLDERARLTTAR